jgi:hypothetical protein
MIFCIVLQFLDISRMFLYINKEKFKKLRGDKIKAKCLHPVILILGMGALAFYFFFLMVED